MIRNSFYFKNIAIANWKKKFFSKLRFLIHGKNCFIIVYKNCDLFSIQYAIKNFLIVKTYIDYTRVAGEEKRYFYPLSARIFTKDSDTNLGYNIGEENS